jgi:hypothetical protein
MRKSLSTLVIAAGLLAAVVAAAPLAGAATGVHQATLAGSTAFPAVKGKAKFGIDNGVRELDVQIENALRLKGVRLDVRISGSLAGRMTVTSLGTARLSILGATVPIVRTGSTIAVRRTSNGALVASGKFG